MRPWYLNRGLVVVVLALFLRATLVPDLAWAQAGGGGEGSGCDLTGQWRSTFGVLDMLNAAPAGPSGALVEAPPPSDIDSLVTGTYRTAKGDGRLEGVVSGRRGEARWYQPDSYAPPADAGECFFEISDDCNELTGKYRGGFEGPFTEPWRARRVAVEVSADSLGDEARAELTRERAAAARRFDAIEAFRARLPREDFEVAARAAAIGGDLGALFSFVQSEIAFEAYAGVLRGARGTLMARAGGAADQSVLLAALLGARGFAVRFAEAELTREAAAQLVASMTVPAREAVPAETQSVLTDELLGAFELDRAAFAAQAERRRAARQSLLDTVADEAAYQQRLIADAPAAVDPARLNETLIEQARRHVWVQARDGEAWVDLDPTWPGAAVGFRAAEPRIHEALPDDLFHRVRFVVTIERKEGDRLVEERVGGWEARVGDIMETGLPAFRILNAPEDAPRASNPGGDIAGLFAAVDAAQSSRLETATAFRPVLVLSSGEIQVGSAFDLSGTLLPDDAQARLAQEVAKTIETGIGRATSILDSLLEEVEAPADAGLGSVLTGEWIEYRIAEPGIDERSARRAVFDRIGPARRAAGETEPEAALDDAAARRALASIYEVLVTGGPISEAFAFDRMTGTFLANRPFLNALLDARFGLPALDNTVLASSASYPNRLLMYLLLQQRMARQAAAAAGVQAYQASANIVAGEQAFGRQDAFRRGLDIVEAGMATGTAEAEAIVAFQRGYGTAITVLEREMVDWMMKVECPECPGSAAVGAAAVMRAAAEQGVPLVTVAPATIEAELGRLAIDADARERIKEAVAAGYVVIAPARAPTVNGAEAIAWWRLDPATGATIGYLGSGTAGAISEYIDTLVAVALLTWPFFFGFAGGWAGCAGVSGDVSGGRGFGCVLCALITGICLELSWLAMPGLGLIAASSTCGLGAGVAGVGVCAVAANVP